MAWHGSAGQWQHQHEHQHQWQQQQWQHWQQQQLQHPTSADQPPQLPRPPPIHTARRSTAAPPAAPTLQQWGSGPLRRWGSGATPDGTPGAFEDGYTPTSVFGSAAQLGAGLDKVAGVAAAAAPTYANGAGGFAAGRKRAYSAAPSPLHPQRAQQYQQFQQDPPLPPQNHMQQKQQPFARAVGGTASNAKQLNRLIGRARSADELLSAIETNWEHLDVINYSTGLLRLAALGEQAGDPADFCKANLAHHPTFIWLLDSLASAAAAPEFGSQALANCLTSLAKLQCGSPALAAALQEPLERCLQATSAASTAGGLQGGHGAGGPRASGLAFTPLGLCATLHALAKDWHNTRATFLAARRWLLSALEEAMPSFDSQAVIMAFWSLAEATSGSTAAEFSLETERPGLLVALEGAARLHAPGLSLQAVATLVSSCARMRPPVRDAALLQTLCNSALSRVVEGPERAGATPAHISTLFGGLASLRFIPEPSWQPALRAPASLLQELSSVMLNSLWQAKPSELSTWAHCAGQLQTVLSPGQLQARSLLAWLVRREPSPAGGALPQAYIQRFSSGELVSVVEAVSAFFRATAATGAALPAHSQMPFFDTLDSVLGMRLGIAAGVDARVLPHPLQLSPHHVGRILSSLRTVPGPGPFPLSGTALEALAGHFARHCQGYDAHSLPHLLAFLAATTDQAFRHASPPPPELLAAAARRAAQLLDEGTLTLSGLARVVHASSVLWLEEPALLCALAPAVTEALTARNYVTEAACTAQDASMLVSGVALLCTNGLLEAAGVPHEEQNDLYRLVLRAADSVARHTPPHLPAFTAEEVGSFLAAEDMMGQRGEHLPPSVAALMPLPGRN